MGVADIPEGVVTLARRLSIVQQDESNTLGDESAPDVALIECDPNAVSDLEFRLKVSTRLLAVEQQAEANRRMLNRVLLRFNLDGRPIPTEDVA